MGNCYNLQNAGLQDVVYSGETHKNAHMGIRPKKAADSGPPRSQKRGGMKKWVQTPRGLPPVAGETSAERAWLVRYFMTRDDQTAFAKLLGINSRTWNQFERGIRPLSRPVIDKIVDVVPGITHLYLIRNVKGGLGPAFLHMLNMSIDASRRRST